MEESLLSALSAAIWSPFTVAFVLCLGFFILAKTRFFALRALPKAVKQALFGHDKELQGALCTALGATMGTGNIVGVATAIACGGAGAVIWLQLSALAGMSLKFSEIALAVKYRRLGLGPMGYLKRLGGFGKLLAVLFAVCCVLASLGSGNMTQSGSGADALACLGVSPWPLAALFFAFTLLCTRDGVNGIKGLLLAVIPVITAGYIALSVWAVICNGERIGGAVEAAVRGAFSFRAAFGGAAGAAARSAMRFGLARGVFSNEAGMGTSPIVFAESGADAVKCGLLGVFEVFADTTVCCTLTSMALLTTPDFASVSEKYFGAQLAIECFGISLGPFCASLSAVLIALFGFCSVCGWYAYGEKALLSLFPKSVSAKKLYRLLYAVGAGVGVIMEAEKIWLISDVLSGVMLLINLLGLTLLSSEVTNLVLEYKNKA